MTSGLYMRSFFLALPLTLVATLALAQATPPPPDVLPASELAVPADGDKSPTGLVSKLIRKGNSTEKARIDTLAEINRILGRSAGTRRLEPKGDGTFARSFVPVGDAFAGLMIPVVESAADALVIGELARIRRCADGRCPRVFYDGTKNGRRRWCDMATCGNRAKAARHRVRLRQAGDPVLDDAAGNTMTNGGNGGTAPDDARFTAPTSTRELR